MLLVSSHPIYSRRSYNKRLHRAVAVLFPDQVILDVALPNACNAVANLDDRLVELANQHGAELVYGLEDHRRYGRLFCHLRATCRRQCLAKDDVTINLQDDVLTLEARVGRHSGRTLTGSVERFSRVVQLPFRVDPEKVQARYNNRPSAAPEELKATNICPSAARELHGSAAAFAMLPAWGKDYLR